MPGCFNNEDAPWLDEDQWLEDAYFLYIIPNPRHGHAEVEGPDNETLDKINAILREKPEGEWELTPDEVKRLGLTQVDDCLKRFNSHDGHYHA